MTRTRFSFLALAIGAGLLVGCTTTDLRVTNDTGSGIYMYSGHTKLMTAVPAGATVEVPQSLGLLIVITEADDVWEYDSFESVTHKSTKGSEPPSLQVHIGTGGIVTLPSGRTLVPTQILQRE